MKADHQWMFCLISRPQPFFRHQDVNANVVPIDDFVTGAVDVEGGELFRVQGSG